MDEPPHRPTGIERRSVRVGRVWRGRRGRRRNRAQAAGPLTLRRVIGQQCLPDRRRYVHGPGTLGLIAPQCLEAAFLGVHMGRCPVPGGVDVEAFPVVPPAGGGFVETAAKGQAVAVGVFENPRFFVEDGRVRDGMALPVARHCRFHVENPLRHQPGQQFQRVGLFGMNRHQRLRQPVGRDLLA